MTMFTIHVVSYLLILLFYNKQTVLMSFRIVMPSVIRYILFLIKLLSLFSDIYDNDSPNTDY